MHNNFYFLRQISSRLDEKLKGFTVVSCFSQNKDEIVLEFNDAKTSFFIRADLQPDFSCLTFPESFKRAKKNSIDLFNDMLMKQVVNVYQYANERSFIINLEDGLGVVFKMHGNKSNVLLVKDNEVVSVFKNNLSGEMPQDREIDWSKETFEQNTDHPERLYFTFGKNLVSKNWSEMQGLKAALEDPKYYIIKTHRHIGFSLVPDNDILHEFSDPFKAVNTFYNLYTSTNAFAKEKQHIVASLNTKINSTRSWLAKTNAKLGELRSDDHYKAWGDLLMANLHRIESNAKEITVENFYNNNVPLTIPLNNTLSPQKNAERYYRKGKNQQIEIKKLTEGLIARTTELTKLELDLARAEDAEDLKLLKEISRTPNTERQTLNTQPFREFEFKGFNIWVGRDAKSNDELTLKYSYKEDLWFHVRDDSGSHVLLKHQANKPFPKDVIEYTASIAAFFSKRKTEALCAVIVTPKKFVRKRKGDPAGAVVVEREEVILVEPKAPH